MEVKNTSHNIYIDPVCLMVAGPSKLNFKTMYEGCAYHFCTDNCRKAFESTPVKYVSGNRLDGKACGNVIQGKGLWRKYLNRLNKITGGKSIRCH